MANDPSIEQALTALREERARIDQAIAALEAVSGHVPGSGGVTIGSGGGGATDARGEIVTHPGEFHQHSLTQATDKILRRGARPMKTNEILAALQRAEFEMGSKSPSQSVYTALARHKGFLKVRPNTWALAEWFPNAAPKVSDGEGKKRRKKFKNHGPKLLTTKNSGKAETEQELKSKTG